MWQPASVITIAFHNCVIFYKFNNAFLQPAKHSWTTLRTLLEPEKTRGISGELSRKKFQLWFPFAVAAQIWLNSSHHFLPFY